MDQPLVPADVVGELIRQFLVTSADVALPRCGGRASHPAILGRIALDELMASPADENPKLLIARLRSRTTWVDTAEAGTIEDVDTPDDYLRIIGEPLADALARRFGK